MRCLVTQVAAPGRALSGLADVEAQIETDEARRAALHAEMAAASADYAAVAALTADLDALSARLDDAVERWSALADRA